MRIDVSSFQQWPSKHRDARDGFADTTSLAAHFRVADLGITTPWIGFVADFGPLFLGVRDRTHAGRVLRSEFQGQVFRLGPYVITDLRSGEEIRRQHQRAVSAAKVRTDVTPGSTVAREATFKP